MKEDKPSVVRNLSFWSPKLGLVFHFLGTPEIKDQADKGLSDLADPIRIVTGEYLPVHIKNEINIYTVMNSIISRIGRVFRRK